ncbi:uncharacterized protein LOC118764397 [Octopus sinensis]|uniref:ATP-dependent DNA helicase n=1 Tax=Octopus sinensis TaxID=2607531 RepID=A0A7E6F075_9MOLL|nr:uncharacterized protein LOC118764397 [Octopus sinensis]
MLFLLKVVHIFGPLSAWMYTVEWQKRGLPHVHMLARCQDRIHPADIDKIISAELPDPNADPQLHSSVTKHMIHGPCGDLNPISPCMKNKRCSKRCPRDYCGQTCTSNDGYPIYRSRDPGFGGRKARVRHRLMTFDADNAWIVPFNVLLSKTFNTHINVEYCSSVRCIQYPCMCINKDDDMAVFVFSDEDLRHDEIKQFVLGRYVSSNYAAWRIFGYEIHLSSPSVFHLNVHLENRQLVYFTEKNAREAIENPKGTTLTAFFELCSVDEFAATLIHPEVPEYYTCNNNKWKRRSHGTELDNWPGVSRKNVIGHVYNIHPTKQELFFLRMLLHVVTGPKSFADLRTFDGVICDTYGEACLRRGLLLNDDHLHRTLAEASNCGTGKTFLISLILAKLRAERRIAIACASSGIAATLLQGGRTAHCAFKLPMDIGKKDNPICNIDRRSSRARLLREYSLFIWDEATMSNKAMFEALDRTLQDFRRNTRIMGGVTFLMARDFRQTLLVVRAGTRADEVNACIKHSYVWHSVISRHLETNMRVHLRGDVESEAFAKQLLDLGDGFLPLVDDEHIRLPFGNFVPNVEDLIRAVLPDVETNFQDLDWLRTRAILSPHNTASDATNKQVLDMIPGEEVSFMSIDTNKDENDFKRYQFPIKLCFAMTINKSQGQSLDIVGVNLSQPVFSHVQLYVACSRVGNPHNLFILDDHERTRNVVYQEALTKQD